MTPRSIATSLGNRRVTAVLLALMAALLLLPGHAAADDEPGEDTPPVISKGIITPGILSFEGGEVSIGADIEDDVGVTMAYAEVIGSDGNFFGVGLFPTGGTSYSGNVSIPANFNEWDVSYTVSVSAFDTNEAYSTEWIGEIQVGPAPVFDERPYAWDPSVQPRVLPASGGTVAFRASASDDRAISEVYATVTPPGSPSYQVQMEPINFNSYEGLLQPAANLGTTVEKYQVEIVALDDIGQQATVDAGQFIVSPAIDPSCTGTGVAGYGSNSLLQLPAQKLWSTAFATDICPGNRAPVFIPTSPSFKGDYIGTEAPPSAAEIPAMTGTDGAHLAVIPVAQTSIAIVARPPKECTIDRITNRQLELVFRGSIERWAELETAKGPRCTAPIKRVVPPAGVGITTQFKRYLARMNGGALPCVGKTWRELSSIEDAKTGAPNTTWPEGCGTSTEIVRPGSVGGGVVQTVNRTRGSIGFAGLPEAKEKDADTILRMQNNGEHMPAGFAGPEAGGKPNCGAISYHVPPEARRRPGGTGLDADWSEVVGANPFAGPAGYPLCMLTYDIAFHGYQYRPDGKISYARAQTVRDYLKELVATPAGQALLAAPGSYYSPLPNTANSDEDVFGAAQFAAAKIRY